MSTPPQISGQSGERPVDEGDDAHTPPRVAPRDYVVAVALTVLVVLAVIFLGGSVE